MKINTKAREGFTLTEVTVVLVILLILSAIVAPSLFKYIEKTKKEKYIWEAQGVFRSVEMYIIVEYQGTAMDPEELFDQLSTFAVTSQKNPLNEYLTVAGTNNARINGMNIQQSTDTLMQLEYLVDDYLVTITRGSSPTIEKFP